MLRTVPLIILLGTINYFGQISGSQLEVPQSKIAQFSEQANVLIQRQISDVGSVRGVRVQAIIATDLFTGTKVKGARFELTASGPAAGAGIRDQKIALLDPDEIDHMIRAIDILKNNILPVSQETFTDVSFTTPDGLSVGATFFERQWRCVLTLVRSEPGSSVPLRSEDLGLLLDLLQQVKAKLK